MLMAALISPPQSGPLCVIGRLGGEGEKKARREQWKEESHFSPPTIHRLLTILLLFCF